MLLVKVGQDLRVGGGREAVAAALQLLAVLDVVVDLSVADGGDRAILTEYRLVTVGRIDDAEAAEPERDTALHVAGLLVRATMSHSQSHSVDQGRVGCASPRHGARDSTHASPPSGSSLDGAAAGHRYHELDLAVALRGDVVHEIEADRDRVA